MSCRAVLWLGFVALSGGQAIATNVPTICSSNPDDQAGDSDSDDDSSNAQSSQEGCTSAVGSHTAGRSPTGTRSGSAPSRTHELDSASAHGLSGGAIAGIIIAVLGAIALLLFILFLMRRRTRNKRTNTHHRILIEGPSDSSATRPFLEQPTDADRDGVEARAEGQQEMIQHPHEYRNSSAANPHSEASASISTSGSRYTLLGVASLGPPLVPRNPDVYVKSANSKMVSLSHEESVPPLPPPEYSEASHS